MPPRVAIVGSGPAALMAAHCVSKKLGAKANVEIFERKPGPGRKFLIAGSSGLNVTNSAAHEDFVAKYSGSFADWPAALKEFTPKDWLKLVEGLGSETFLGTSGRYFVKEMRASKLLRSWMQKLAEQGVKTRFRKELTDFKCSGGQVQLAFGKDTEVFDAVLFCLGGLSYEKDPSWPALFEKKNIAIEPIEAANVGFEVEWPQAFFKEAEGKPLKNVIFKTKKGARQGDLMVTRYGLEGTPVYELGVKGDAQIDLFPDLTEKEILSRCESVRENLAPIRRMKKKLKLSPVTEALLFHCAPKAALQDLRELCALIKSFPVKLLTPRPIEEAISTSGGVSFKELDNSLMLKKFPGIFLAGEMLDWSAPTGGFLIQGCVSLGFRAGSALASWVARVPR